MVRDAPRQGSSGPDAADRRGGRVDAQRILVIHNPTAGWRRPHLLQDLVARLRAAGRMVSVLPTQHPEHAIELAQQAGDGGWDLVVAAGGDGTINEVLNGLRHGRTGAAGQAEGQADDFLTDRRPAGGLPLALCPLGTANVLAREIGLGFSAAALADCILEGRLLDVAIGECSGPGIADRVFVQMLGAGFDAQVVAGVSREMKRHLGRWAYVLVTARQAFTYHSPVFEVRLDGRSHTASSVIVSNGRYYGGPYISAPDADLRDDSFQVCLFHRSGPLHVARYGLALLVGRLSRLSDVSLHTARTIEIVAPPGEPVQGDGDFFGSTPVSIRLAPRRQCLVIPRPERHAR